MILLIVSVRRTCAWKRCQPDHVSKTQPSARSMDPVPTEVLPAGALTPSHPLWRAAAKAMARFSPAPLVTEETVRLYYRCREMHGRCSAKLLQKEQLTESREHSSGFSVETAFWLVPKTNFRAAASCAADIQVPVAVAAYQVSPAVIEDQSMIGCQLDFDNYFVIDQACSRSLLGIGVSQIVLSESG